MEVRANHEKQSGVFLVKQQFHSHDSPRKFAMNTTDVGQFCDALKADDTDEIERCFPGYREMLWTVLEYLPADGRFAPILELGSTSS